MFNSFKFNTRRYNQLQLFINQVIEIVPPTIELPILVNDLTIIMTPVNEIISLSTCDNDNCYLLYYYIRCR